MGNYGHASRPAVPGHGPPGPDDAPGPGGHWDPSEAGPELPFGFIEVSPILRQVARTRAFCLGFGHQFFHSLKPLEQRLAPGSGQKIYLPKGSLPLRRRPQPGSSTRCRSPQRQSGPPQESGPGSARQQTTRPGFFRSETCQGWPDGRCFSPGQTAHHGGSPGFPTTSPRECVATFQAELSKFDILEHPVNHASRKLGQQTSA